jgi:hypothetical protein
MSRYTEFACLDCKVYLFIGKAVVQGGTNAIWCFARGGIESPPNSQQPELTRSLWKMLADHAGHNLRVVVEGSPDEDLVTEDFVEIGGDRNTDISFEEYLKDWPG